MNKHHNIMNLFVYILIVHNYNSYCSRVSVRVLRLNFRLCNCKFNQWISQIDVNYYKLKLCKTGISIIHWKYDYSSNNNNNNNK